MTGGKSEDRQGANHATLVRLAKSCLRAAARGNVVSPMAPDLNPEDYAAIAGILEKLADQIAPT